MKAATGFTDLQERVTSWGPFLVPQGPEFTATDLGNLGQGGHPLENFMVWGYSLDTTPEMKVRSISADSIGDMAMEMLTAQALLCVPHVDWRKVMPLESVGRIITFDLDPQPPPERVYVQQPVSRPRQKYADGDPPAAMLFLAGFDSLVTRAYHQSLEWLICRKDGRRLQGILPDVLGSSVGVLTQAEVFYFLFRTASLVTQAYQQEYREQIEILD